ncbi:hypothetical protein D3C86_1669500 [compost metagenome]
MRFTAVKGIIGRSVYFFKGFVRCLITAHPVVHIMIAQCLEKRDAHFGHCLVVIRKEGMVVPYQVAHSYTVDQCIRPHGFHQFLYIRHRSFHHLLYIPFVLYLRIGPDDEIVLVVVPFECL